MTSSNADRLFVLDPPEAPASVESIAVHRQQAVINEINRALQSAGGDVTDIESVLDRTSLTREEVLEHFDDMHAVVMALVESLVGAMLQPLKSATAAAPARDILLQFGSRLTAEACRWQLRSLYRIALTESIRNRTMGADFYHRGPGMLTTELARVIERGQAAGAIGSGDAYVLASQFMALLRVGLDDEGPDRTSGNSDVAQIVELFCSGIQTGANHA